MDIRKQARKALTLLIVITMLIITLQTTIATPQPNTGALALLELNNNDSEAWRSLTTNSVDMTYITNYRTYNVSGTGSTHAGDFNGTTEYVNITSDAPLKFRTDEDFSICFDYMDTVYENSKAIVGNYRQEGIGNAGYFYIYTGVTGYGANCDGDAFYVVMEGKTNAAANSYSACWYGDNMFDGNWHNWCFVYDYNGGSETCQAYADGVALTESVQNGQPCGHSLQEDMLDGGNSGDWAFGTNGRTANNFGSFYGDNFMIYNYSLNTTEIGNIYNYGNISGGTPPTINTAPNITNIIPTNNSHENTVTISFNATDNEDNTLNCTLYINETSNTTWTNKDITTNKTFTTVLTPNEGWWNWNANCTDGENTTIGETWNFLVDTTNPTITTVTPNTNNASTYNNYEDYWIPLRARFQDTYLFGYNLTIIAPDGTTTYQNITTGLTVEDYNFTYNLPTRDLTSGQYNITLMVEDDHTAQLIPEYENTKTNYGLEYNTETAIIKIETKNTLNYEDATTTKLTDRYTFNFDHKIETTQTNYRLTSNKKLWYRENLYPFPSFVTGKQWVDFNTQHKSATYKVTKINDYTYDIQINYKSLIKKEEFQSLGGLNQVILNWNYELLNSHTLVNHTLEQLWNNTNITDFNVYVNGILSAYACYQESFNISNQTGRDGTCPLEYTGTHTVTSGDPVSRDRSNLWDGDWTTSYFYNDQYFDTTHIFNYNITPYQKASEIYWNFGIRYSGTIYNKSYQLPTTCTQRDILNLRFLYQDQFGGTVFLYWSCNQTGGAGWHNMELVSSSYTGIYAYDESLILYISNQTYLNTSQLYNITYESTGNFNTSFLSQNISGGTHSGNTTPYDTTNPIITTNINGTTINGYNTTLNISIDEDYLINYSWQIESQDWTNWGGKQANYTYNNATYNITSLNGIGTYWIYINATDFTGNSTTFNKTFTLTANTNFLTLRAIDYLGLTPIASATWYENHTKTTKIANPYQEAIENYLNKTTSWLNLTFNVTDNSGAHRNYNGSVNITRFATEFNITMLASQLILNFYQNGSIYNSTGFISDTSTPPKRLDFYNTSFLVVQSILAEGLVHVRFGDNTSGNWTQYYEYNNAGYTHITEDLEILQQADTSIHVQALDNARSPLDEVQVRAQYMQYTLNNWTNATLLGQRLTGDDGITFFIADSTTQLVLTFTKDGYDPVDKPITVGDEAFTRTSPLQVFLTKSETGVDDNVWIYSNKWLYNTTTTITAMILAIGKDRIQYQTDYMISQGLAIQDITNTCDALDRCIFTLNNGTEFVNDQDLLIHVYIDNLYWGNRTVEVYETVNKTNLFEPPDIESSVLAPILLIALIIVTAGMSIRFRGTNIGLGTWTIGTIIIALISEAFIWLAFITMLGISLRYIYGVIRE